MFFEAGNGTSRQQALLLLTDSKRSIAPHHRPRPVRRFVPHVEMQIALVVRPVLFDAHAQRAQACRHPEKLQCALTPNVNVGCHTVDMRASGGAQ